MNSLSAEFAQPQHCHSTDADCQEDKQQNSKAWVSPCFQVTPEIAHAADNRVQEYVCNMTKSLVHSPSHCGANAHAASSEKICQACCVLTQAYSQSQRQNKWYGAAPRPDIVTHDVNQTVAQKHEIHTAFSSLHRTVTPWACLCSRPKALLC